MAPEEIYTKLLSQVDAGRKGVLLSLWQKPQAEVRKWLLTEDAWESDLPLPPQGLALAQRALETAQLQVIESGGILWIAEPAFAAPRLVVLGGGHIAAQLVPLAAECGFAITVVDDRPEFADPLRFPAARRVLCVSFSTCFLQLSNADNTFVVIVTRGHKHDLICVRQALQQKLAYLGVIGSHRRTAGMRQRLRQDGYPAEDIQRIHAPIGLEIGAETIQEIAVSIVAELIQVRRSQTTGPVPEFERQVVTALAGGVKAPSALATVIRAAGSTPRSAGAKMVVCPDGSLIGSVGGGLGEALAIAAAKRVILNRLPETVHIEMTGDPTAEEGQVCGGGMTLFVEPL